VVDLDPETNRVIVGDTDDLLMGEFEIDRVNWHVVGGIGDPGSSFEATVKIRYNHPGTAATIVLSEDDRARVCLHEPQRAVTPGQAAVIYNDDVVLGGGWICRRESHRERSETQSKDPAIVA
jgi:tRNA-specific 2-thiouridylase